MRKFTWKKWTAIGILLTFIIAEAAFVFINPLVAICGVAGFVIGSCMTYFYLKNKNITK